MIPWFHSIQGIFLIAGSLGFWFYAFPIIKDILDKERPTWTESKEKWKRVWKEQQDALNRALGRNT